MTTTEPTTTSDERADLLAMLGKHRYFLRHTVEGLTDEQAAQTPTVSELCPDGPDLARRRAVHGTGDETDYADYANGFRMLPGETLAGLLETYDEVARGTDDLVTTLPDLGLSHELPPAPWFEPGARWSARRVLMHIVAETAQHSGHADILRETLDGQKSMG